MLRIPLTIPLFTVCTSTKFLVPDDQFFTDGHTLDANYVQFVESAEDPALNGPAAERYRANCAAAWNKAGVRYKSKYPQATDTGKLLSERFDKNAGCTVRIAFRIP
jgi:hypothetical protein